VNALPADIVDVARINSHVEQLDSHVLTLGDSLTAQDSQVNPKHLDNVWEEIYLARGRFYIVLSISRSNLGYNQSQDFNRTLTSNVWMLILSSPSVKHLIIRESWNPLSGIFVIE
jgi:hypothetical protein